MNENRRQVLEMLSTGKITAETKFDSTDFRSTIPRFSDENRKTNQALVNLVSAFAERKKATPAQVALAWLLAKKPWIVPIPGTTKLNRLEENLGTLNVELTPEDLDAIESASSRIKIEGARYPKFHEKLVGAKRRRKETKMKPISYRILALLFLSVCAVSCRRSDSARRRGVAGCGSQGG